VHRRGAQGLRPVAQLRLAQVRLGHPGGVLPGDARGDRPAGDRVHAPGGLPATRDPRRRSGSDRGLHRGRTASRGPRLLSARPDAPASPRADPVRGTDPGCTTSICPVPS